MVSVIALLVLVTIVILIAVMSLRVADTGVNDSLNQSSNVAALFLAESGLEYATQQLSTGVLTCGTVPGTTQSFGRGNFTVSGAWATDFNGLALPTSQCRVQVSGKVNNSDVTRTVQGIINYSAASGVALDSSTSIARNFDDNISFPVTVAAAGTNRLLLVGVSLRLNSSGQSVSSVSYAGVSMTRIAAVNNPSPTSPVRVELWQLVSPLTGSNNVQVILSSGKTGVVAGAVSLTGVDQSAPVEASNTAINNSSTASVSVTTTTNNAWVVDVLGFMQSSPIRITGTSQSQAGNVATGGNPSLRIRGAGSTLGPKSPAGTVNMSWLLSGTSRNWSLAAAVIKPAVGGGVGILSWREIVY